MKILIDFRPIRITNERLSTSFHRKEYLASPSLNFSTLSNNIACFCDKLLISRPTQYFHVYSNDTICPVLLASKQCETYGDDRKENDREKFYITIVKWTNRVENGVKRRVDGSFHWRAQNLWHSARRRGGGGRPRLRLYRFPVARMRESIIRFHIFFFSLSSVFFPPYFSSLPLLSALLFTVATTADICVAVIERHCFRKNLFVIVQF